MKLVWILGMIIPLSGKAQEEIPRKNKEVLEFVTTHGRDISPTYQTAVCTELVIAVLEHFISLTEEDKSRVRIITKEDVFEQIKLGSPVPKGVYYALTANSKGQAIDRMEDVKPGDFVQFWYESWGHCGIVDHIDLENKLLFLHSSFPSTDGYGIQEFIIPEEIYFVRLK